MICDFGLTKFLGDEHETMTMSDFAGTVRYIAYELVKPEGSVISTKESDMYALGCVALEVCW
jgi:serine/threonine protein kinase